MAPPATILWWHASVVGACVALVGARAFFLWRASRRGGKFTVRAVDGSFTKTETTLQRAEKTALAAAQHAPLEIVEPGGKVIGRLGFGHDTARRLVGDR